MVPELEAELGAARDTGDLLQHLARLDRMLAANPKLSEVLSYIYSYPHPPDVSRSVSGWRRRPLPWTAATRCRAPCSGRGRSSRGGAASWPPGRRSAAIGHVTTVLSSDWCRCTPAASPTWTSTASTPGLCRNTANCRTRAAGA